MKWIYYLVIYAIVDSPIYFADWNGSKNVFPCSMTDNKACGLCATKSEQPGRKTYKWKPPPKKTCIFPWPRCWWSSISPFPSPFGNQEDSRGPIVNNGIVIHHLIMIWQMHAPSPFSASSSLSILRSAKLSRTPPVGLIRAVCLCEAAGALGAAGARHCQWTERLTLPGSCTQTHASRSPCYCFHLNPFLLASLPTWDVRVPSSSPSHSCPPAPRTHTHAPSRSSLSNALRPPSFASASIRTTQRNGWMRLWWGGDAGAQGEKSRKSIKTRTSGDESWY